MGLPMGWLPAKFHDVAVGRSGSYPRVPLLRYVEKEWRVKGISLTVRRVRTLRCAHKLHVTPLQSGRAEQKTWSNWVLGKPTGEWWVKHGYLMLFVLICLLSKNVVMYSNVYNNN